MLTEKELQAKYNLSANALKQRIKKLKLVPTKGDRGTNLFNVLQVELLDQQHEHLRSGGTLDNFVPPTEVEIVPTSTRLVPIERKPKQPSVFEQTFQELSYTDPFYDFESLQRAADKSWHLPTEKLAVILGKTPSSFSNAKSFIHQGFVIVRQDVRSGNSYLWSINANQ